MTTASVTSISSAKKKTTSRRTRSVPKLTAWEKQASKYMVGTLAVVILTMLGVSLEHLASGIQSITGTAMLGAWSLAVAVDCGMVTSEIALIMLSRLPDLGVEKYAKRFVIATILISMALNVLAFWPSELKAVPCILAVVLGCGIPAGVYHLTRVAGKIWLATAKK